MALVAPPQSSAAGALALLSEPDPAFKQYALRGLNHLVAQFWAEISEHIALMYVLTTLLCCGGLMPSTSESLHESKDMPVGARDVAALLASKVYYYLGEYDEALSFALGAGAAFEAEATSGAAGEYVETVICLSSPLFLVPLADFPAAKAIDRYVQLRSQDAPVHVKIDPRLQSIIESIFRRCIDEGEYKQVTFSPSFIFVLLTVASGNRNRIGITEARYRVADIRTHPCRIPALVRDGSRPRHRLFVVVPRPGPQFLGTPLPSSFPVQLGPHARARTPPRHPQQSYHHSQALDLAHSERKGSRIPAGL